MQHLLPHFFSWLAAHGFTLSNREWAALAWLLIVGVFVLSISDARSSLLGILRRVLFTKLLIVFLFYAVWIVAFIQIMDWLGIWRALLTKDTLVWSVTTGIALLLGVTEIKQPGYFWRALSEVAGATVVVEYLLNLASFSIWIEFILQPVIFFFVVAPVAAKDTESQKIWTKMRFWFSLILISSILIHTILSLTAPEQIVNWEFVALQTIWPILLGIWVLILMLILAVAMAYEGAFLRLSRYRDRPDGLWKAKVGLMLALGLRLNAVHEAAKGGTHRVARAKSVSDAYEAATEYKKGLTE
ncbi:hypothetical protein [Halogeometricum limi]|uniref:Uncharacterized protein n=1 Tax=Halogeometricum limi TaxID=555875 RepID=A0A1I6FWF5_9EURY|nr:hypothetical protein [Halogeometricum limi]SFR34238.1 hypothetical protein SAMN04488124_0427 [Halogeometricum limi]